MLTCHILRPQVVPLVQWKIQFNDISLPDVTETFSQPYQVGTILRDTIHHGDSEAMFTFNFTSIESSTFESVLNANVYDFFNGAIIQCGEDLVENYATVIIHTIDGMVCMQSLL